MSDIVFETKEQRVFSALMAGESFNLFEAQIKLHDRCLHSTISTLQKKHGITISRVFETAKGYQGLPTLCCRYWIERHERERFKAERKRA